MKLLLPLVLFAALTNFLQGCAGVFVVGAATGAKVLSDQRTAGTIVEDQSIELKAWSTLKKHKATHQAHVNITSFNNVVLVTGEAPNQDVINNIIQLIRPIQHIRKIHNELTIGKPSSMESRGHDTWLTTKVKSTLLTSKGLETVNIKVVSENSTVYLLGITNRKTGNAIASAVQQVEGVDQVVKLFEYP